LGVVGHACMAPGPDVHGWAAHGLGQALKLIQSKRVMLKSQ